MSKLETKFLNWVIKRVDIVIFSIMMVLTLIIYIYLGNSINVANLSTDFNNFLKPWWNEFIRYGHFKALSHQIGDYNIAYQTLLAWMSTWHTSCQNALKLFGGVTTFVLSLFVGILTFNLTNKKNTFYLFIPCLSVLILPTVFLNSIVWVQCDALYSLFIICSLLAFYCDHWNIGMLCFGLSLSFKLQAIMLLPFIVILYLLQRKHSILTSIGLIFIGFYIPNVWGIFYGRSIFSPFLTYIKQGNEYPDLSVNAINVCQLLRSNNPFNYQIMKPIMILITFLILSVVIIYLTNNYFNLQNNFIFLATWIMWTCYMFLPAMHERYDFCVELLLLVSSFLSVKYLPSFIIVIISDTIIYCNYLFGTGYNTFILSVFMIIAYGMDTWLLLFNNKKIFLTNAIQKYKHRN